MKTAKTKSVTIIGSIFILLGTLNLFGRMILFLGVPLITIGIGILKRKKWARQAGISFQYFQILLSVGGFLSACWAWNAYVENNPGLAAQQTAQNIPDFIISGLIILIINLGTSMGLIYWMNKLVIREEINF